MTCSRCGLAASAVKLTFRSALPKEVCLDCAKLLFRDSFPASDFDLVRFWTVLANPRAPNILVPADSFPVESTCPSCGLTFGEFAEHGLAGCEECYAAFREVILPALVALNSGPT